jgi:hypothetical protein
LNGGGVALPEKDWHLLFFLFLSCCLFCFVFLSRIFGLFGTSDVLVVLLLLLLLLLSLTSIRLDFALLVVLPSPAFERGSFTFRQGKIFPEEGFDSFEHLPLSQLGNIAARVKNLAGRRLTYTCSPVAWIQETAGIGWKANKLFDFDLKSKPYPRHAINCHSYVVRQKCNQASRDFAGPKSGGQVQVFDSMLYLML